MLEQLHGVLGNWGLAILALTVVVKVVLFPLYNRQYAMMAKMRPLQPKMKEIQEKYKGDPARQQQEMLAMYQREGVNPVAQMAGCLPILLTIPVFFALFKVLSIAIEMRHAPFFGWIQDLAGRDPTTFLNLFGLIPWDPATAPVIGHFLDTSLHIGVLPILSGLTTWLTMALNPPAPDPVQQKIFQLMPVVFTFILAQFASGLLVYYIWSNLLTVLQQYVIFRRHKADNVIDQILRRLSGKPAPPT
jgi:YidC/Oxa1 family membrane protein insertase